MHKNHIPLVFLMKYQGVVILSEFSFKRYSTYFALKLYLKTLLVSRDGIDSKK